jgi:hypothetical protein
MSILGTLKVMLTADTGQFQKDLKKGEKSVSSFKKEFSGMAAGLAGAFTAGAVVAGLKNIITSTADYAKTVEDLSRNLGISTEESSTLLQMTDDLEISQGALEMGMKTALRQGITPNIEGIKGLAEQYQALNTPAERAAFALKTFGKNGLEMSKILEKTPEQIQAMADALEGSSLIMGDDAVQAAKDYRLALDNANDTIAEVKVTIGNALLPPLTDAIEFMGRGVKAGVELAGMLGTIADLIHQRSDPAYAALVESIELANSAAVTASGDAGMGAYNRSLEVNAAKADDAAGANNRVAMSITEVTKTSAAKKAVDVLTEAYMAGTLEGDIYAVKMSDIMRNWLDMPMAQVTASLAMQTIEKDLQDGKIEALGAASAILGVGAAADSVNGKRSVITIHTQYTTAGAPLPGNPKEGNQKRAGGGPVTAGSAYLVGEQGPELFVPSQSGNIISNRNIGSVNINVTAPTASGEQLYREIKRRLLDDMRAERLRA